MRACVRLDGGPRRPVPSLGFPCPFETETQAKHRSARDCNSLRRHHLCIPCGPALSAAGERDSEFLAMAVLVPDRLLQLRPASILSSLSVSAGCSVCSPRADLPPTNNSRRVYVITSSDTVQVRRLGQVFANALQPCRHRLCPDKTFGGSSALSLSLGHAPGVLAACSCNCMPPMLHSRCSPAYAWTWWLVERPSEARYGK